MAKLEYFQALVILHLQLQITVGVEVCLSEFTTFETCLQEYGASLPTVYTPSYLQCGLICAKDPLCHSLLYSMERTFCIPNEDTLVYPNNTCTKFVNYYEKTKSCGGSSLKSPNTSATLTPASSTSSRTGPTYTSSTFPTSPGPPYTTSSSTFPTSPGPPYTTTSSTFPTSPGPPYTTSSSTFPTSPGPQIWMYMNYPHFYMSDPCSVDTDCSYILNSVCRDGICQCIRGYSFDWITGSCLQSCLLYGNSYQVEYGFTFNHYTSKEIQFATEYYCLDSCEMETTFVCRSVVYDTAVMLCIYSSESPLDHPQDVLPKTDVNLYQRDCLF